MPEADPAVERTDFVREEFRRVGRQADEGAMRALLDAVGTDLRELASAVGHDMAVMYNTASRLGRRQCPGNRQ